MVETRQRDGRERDREGAKNIQVQGSEGGTKKEKFEVTDLQRCIRNVTHKSCTGAGSPTCPDPDKLRVGPCIAQNQAHCSRICKTIRRSLTEPCPEMKGGKALQ
jgi:hypothetical protein